MDLIADGLFIATALTAALYCFVLSRRLRRLSDAETGIGSQIHALNKALEETRSGLSETRRGVAEARASVRNASESLAVEVEAARREVQLLASARTAAMDTLALIDAVNKEAKTAEPAAQEPAPKPEAVAKPVETPPPPEQVVEHEDIPDWPDGVVDLPDEDAADAAFLAAEPIAEDALEDTANQEDAPPQPTEATSENAAPLRMERLAL
ncbi:MAG: hypothetical protein AAF183_14830 [Pseudomonadota bacterium]